VFDIGVFNPLAARPLRRPANCHKFVIKLNFRKSIENRFIFRFCLSVDTRGGPAKMVQPGCSRCQSYKIVRDIPINVRAESGHYIYLGYKNRESDWFSKDARILGEVCNDCGNVRLYVKETNKNWNT
jgi:hypothetical protein